MIYKIITITLGFLAVILLFQSCQRSGSEQPRDDWAAFTGELETIVESKEADSLKIQRIKLLFEKYAVTVEDYEEFYSDYVEKHPTKSIKFLESVQNLINEDMRAVQEEYKRQMIHRRDEIRSEEKLPKDSANKK